MKKSLKYKFVIWIGAPLLVGVFLLFIEYKFFATNQKFNGNSPQLLESVIYYLRFLFSKENLKPLVHYVYEFRILIAFFIVTLILIRITPDIVRRYEEWKHRDINDLYRHQMMMSQVSEQIRYKEDFKNDESYKIRLGKRHKVLREKYLNFNPREMADFYGFDLVSKLEEFETGEKEFTVEMLKRLSRFFFVNRKFFEEGYSYIFDRFNIHTNEPKELISEGFRPYFLCCPEYPSPDFTYIILHRIQDGFGRTAVGRLVSSFASNGGGRLNIEAIISAMIANGLKSSDARVLNVNLETWLSIENQTFYSRDMLTDRRIEDVNFDNQYIFLRWYRQVEHNDLFYDKTI